MACPNINSPEWKALVSKIGEMNAWKEFLVHDRIPDASIYEVEDGGEVKTGVEELFESNPELANQVYEALGFNISNIEGKKAIEKAWKLHGEALEKVFVTLSNDEKPSKGETIFIHNIETDEENRSKGLGLATYITLGEQIIKEGARFISSGHNLWDSTKIWERLYNLKLAIKTPSIGGNTGFTYEYVGLQNEITPQQKQQAQQLYSQYLDSIFPDSKVKDIVYHGSKTNLTLRDYLLYNSENLKSVSTALWVDGVLDDDRSIIRSLSPQQRKEYEKQGRFESGEIYNFNDGTSKYYKDSELDKIYNKGRFEKFRKKEHDYGGLDTFLGTGNYFTTSKKNAEKYADPHLYSAIINVRNAYTEGKGYQNTRSGKGSQELIDKGYDAVTEKINNGQEYNVFEPEQIHILGSKQDIEGFKKFAETNKPKNVLYSIKTKTTAQLAKGINPKLIKSHREIKYTSFILNDLLNSLGDLTPGRALDKTPDEAFGEIKNKYTKLRNSINMALESFIKSDEDLKKIKASDSLSKIVEKFPVIEWVSSYDELLTAKETFDDIVDNWKRYEGFVRAGMVSKGLKIVKNKIKNVDPQDIENKNQDETEDTSISNEEVNPQKFDASAFEVNPYTTATTRVKAMVQTIETGTYEFGIPIYADPADVMDDLLYAGVSMNLSKFNDDKSKLNALREGLAARQEGRPYIEKLMQKINAAEKKGDWSIINQILTFASKAFANEEILLYTLRKTGSKINGVSDVKIIGGNRDTIIEQIKRDWLSKHQISGFYDRKADGSLIPNAEKLEELNRIRLEGQAATGDAQKRKFIEYFNVLGIKFTMKDLNIIAPKINKKFNKGKDFGIVFSDKNLLHNIYTDFLKNKEKNVPFEGQYGFQNEGKEMGYLAQLYFDATPGVYKAGSSKTADGKSKFLYIQTSSAEISKREFDQTNGVSLFNTALAKPNAVDERSFWKKVKQLIYKFTLGYFNGSREQQAGKDGKVRKNYTEKDQMVVMLLGHQADMKEGTYITFTLSDKTTSMQTKMTKEFFVDSDKIPVGLGKDFVIKNNKIEYRDEFKDRVYNSFVEPEISRILAAMKHGESVNLENFDIASKLFYFIPKLNTDESLEDFRKDLYSGKFTIEELNKKYAKQVANVVISEFEKASESEIVTYKKNGIIEVDKSGNYTFPLYKRSYVARFRETEAQGKNLAMLMSMDMKLNYMNSQVKTVQYLKFDPMNSFKKFKGFKGTDFNSISPKDKIKLVKSTWDEFSKRAAALIAPGSQGSWTWEYDIQFDNEGNKTSSKTYTSNTYRAVTLKDVKRDVANYKDVETTDAQEFVTLQEHIDYLMSQGRIPLSVWQSVYDKIKKAGPGGYYTLTKEELGYVFTPMKPVYAGSSQEAGDEAGLNRYDYIKTSRYPLIPQHERGSERDKLRQWMEKNNIASANFGSGKKLGRPSLSLEVFDKDNNFIEPKDFDKSIQELSRDGLRNQQEIPAQKQEIATVSQMNRTLLDGLTESIFNFSGMSKISGKELKGVKEAIRSKMFDNAAAKLKEKIGDLHKTNVGLYNLLKETIENDTTGSYTKNDLRSLRLNDKGMFEIPLEAQFKFPKFQGLINSMINKNVMLKVEGTSFVQVSGVGAKFNFKDIGKGMKSDIIWTSSFAKQFKNVSDITLDYISKDERGNVKPAQVIVSQYLRDSEGNLINLEEYITEKDGVKILDTSRFSPEMLQLVASRIPNQSHVSMLPIEVVGFLPSYMENTIIVPDGITGQMGSDFDVDKLFAYTSKIVDGTNKKGEKIHKAVEYSINSLADIDKLTPDQLAQAYRDIHWEVLTHEDAFDKIAKSVDNPEVGEKVALRQQQLEDYEISSEDEVNLPLDYQTSIKRFTDNKSGKDGVSIYANLISAQADLQDKPLRLGYKDDVTGKDVEKPIKIKINGKIVDFVYIGKTGESTSFVNKKRSVSDNLNIQFTESVDNAKNQFLREFNWDEKSMGAMGVLSMLTSKEGEAVPIEFMMDMCSQPVIKKLLEEMDLKQDSFGVYDTDALNSAVSELTDVIIDTVTDKKYLKTGDSVGAYLMDSDRDKSISPEDLANMWLVGQAIKAGENPETLKRLSKDLNFKSVDDMLLKYYTTQFDSLELFAKLHGLGRELMTILGSLYVYTKGIGPTVFSAKQKLNQLNKLASSENFLGIQDLAGVIEKDKESGRISIAPKGELGSSIKNSLIVAQNQIYNYLCPIATGKELEDIVVDLLAITGLKLNDVNGQKYEGTFNTAFKSAIHYMYTNPDLQLFEDVRETRDRLINGENSLAKRITRIKEDPQWAKNGFLKNLQTDPIWKSDVQTISFKSPFGAEIDSDAVEAGFFELVTYKGEGKDEIRELARDLALYVFATGDAGNMGRYIPVDYFMSDDEFARGMRRIRGTFNDNIRNDNVRNEFIDQVVQNNPDDFSKSFNFHSSESYESTFKTLLKPRIGNSDDLSNVSEFTISRGDFKGDAAKGIVDSLTVPMSDRDIAIAVKNKINPYTINEKGKQETKPKYPDYILITDRFRSDYDDYDKEREIKYLYKRISPALVAGPGEGTATYKKIPILGIGNIKEFDSNPDNQGLSSVIKNNAIDISNQQIFDSNTGSEINVSTEKPKERVIENVGKTTPQNNKIDNTDKPEFNKLPGKSATPTMTYAGIGSRETPQEVLELMTKAAQYLDGLGYTLNTGKTFLAKPSDDPKYQAQYEERLAFSKKHNGKVGLDEEGADRAFSLGATKKNLFGVEKPVGKREMKIAEEIHPNWEALVAKGPGGPKLMARNTNQVFGANLDTPVDFVLFYAEDKGKTGKTGENRPEGGTGQAVEMARAKGIPTINMADANWRDQLKAVISTKAAPVATLSSTIREYTPEKITSLKPNEVFVFGSNTEGRHSLGAAKTAADNFGAKYGQPEGLQGQSYAIVTKNLTSGIEMFGRKITKTGKRSIERFEIREQLEDLMDFAENNPDKKFYITKLGTENAGFSVLEIKELFERIKDVIPDNVVLPKEFEVRQVGSKSSTEEKNKINIYAGTGENAELSNFAVRPFTNYEGQKFNTVEGAYQSAKLDYSSFYHYPDFGGPKDSYFEMIEKFEKATGAQAKALGQQIKGLDKNAWDADSSRIMKDLIKASFEQNPEALKKLLATGNAELTHTQDNSKWKTEFPKLLMEVRDELKSFKPSTGTFEEEPIEEPTIVNYKNTPYIIEGSTEEGWTVYTVSKGQKSKLVTDADLYHKVTLTHEVNIHPEWVVQLTNMQHQPKYFVNDEGAVISLTPSSFGNYINSPDIYNRVMRVYNNKSLTPIQDEPVASKPEETKYTPNYIEVNGKKIETFKWDNEKKIPIKLTNDQTKAVKAMVDHIEKNPGVPFILKGKAGTGKTTVIRVVNEYFKNKSSVIITPTHKAGKNASIVTYGNTQSQYRTYHSCYLGRMEKADMFIFDEVSMLGYDELATVMKKTPKDKTIIFMGDERQLPPVRSSKLSPFFYSKDKSNVYELNEVMRFDEQGSIFKIANAYAENLKNYSVIKQFPKQLISDKDAVYSVDSSKRLVDAYIHFYREEKNDPSKVRLVCFGNKTAELYNNQIRGIIYEGNAQFNVVNNNELLTGNAGWSTKSVLDSPMVNSSEYKVIETPQNVKRDYGRFTFEGQAVKFKEIVSGKFDVERNITIIDPAKEANKDIYNHIACNIINMKNLSPYARYESAENDELNSIEKSGIYSLTTMYAKPVSKDLDGKVTSVNLYTIDQMLKIIKEENPELSEDEVLTMIDNDKVKEYYKIEPNVSFGYAITTHKSQGSTYKHVLVDESNMSFRDRSRKVDDENDEFFAYEANQMRYVGFSRPTTTLVIYTKKPIGDELIYNDDKSGEISSGEKGATFSLSSFFASTVKTDAEEDTFGVEGENRSTKDILNAVYKNGSPLIKEILSLVGKTGGVGNLKIIVDRTIKNPGEYDKNTKTIRINPELGISDGIKDVRTATSQLHELIVHEVLHHVTNDLLQKDPMTLTGEQRKWVVSLKTLFKTTQEKLLKDPLHAEALRNAIEASKKSNGHLSEKDKSMYYGLTDVNEFVSMLMTDEKFRNFMNETSYEGGKSILDRFIEVLGKILQALGINIKDNSVLKEGLTDIVGLIQSRDGSFIDVNDAGPLRSITTDSAKVKTINENFESLVKTLNIKTQCD